MNSIFFDFDLTFSYWILLWFFIYELGFTTFNPKIWLILGLLENIFLLLLFFYYKYPPKLTMLFIVIVFFQKVVPLWILRKTEYRKIDFIAGIILFILFVFYIIYSKKSINNVLNYGKNNFKKIKEGKPMSPLIDYLDKTGYIK